MIKRTVSSLKQFEISRFGSARRRKRDEFISLTEIEELSAGNSPFLCDLSVDEAVDLFDRGEISDIDLIERLAGNE